jgi:pSer/pThr/pTyr-binding forkhead associated (FHA) protein
MMAGQSFQLVVRAGPTPGKVYPIMKKEIIIGRDPNSDVLINDAEISRHHAAIKFQPEGFVIEDLGSTNGTVINGQRLMGPHVLHPGEIINLGEHISLVFDRQMAFDPDATMVSPVSAVPTPPVKAQTPVYPEPMVEPYTPLVEQTPETPTKSPPRLLLILILVAILLVICGCIGILWYIDSHFLWCNVMPFLPACK